MPKTKKIIILCIVTVLLFKFSFIITGPHSGRIINAVSGKPLQNIRVDFIADASCYLGLGLEICSETIRRETTFTDEQGTFHIPLKIHFLPFDLADSELLRINSAYFLGDNDTGVTSSYYHHFISYETRLIDIQQPAIENFKLNKKLFKGKIEIPLIPKIQTIVECEKIKDAHIKNDCVRLNAYQVALKTADRDLCAFAGDDRLLCLNDLHPKSKQISMCDCRKLYGVSLDDEWKYLRGGIYPESLNQIENDGNLCIAFCSWQYFKLDPRCDKISTKNDREICYQVHSL